MKYSSDAFSGATFSADAINDATIRKSTTAPVILRISTIRNRAAER
jgi:hypothetical protein